MARFGEFVVELLPLFKLGGDPVASSVDNRLDPLVELDMELDIGFYFYVNYFQIYRAQLG